MFSSPNYLVNTSVWMLWCDLFKAARNRWNLLPPATSTFTEKSFLAAWLLQWEDKNTLDSRQSVVEGWNDDCLVQNNEPTAPSGESARQRPRRAGIEFYKKEKTKQTKKPQPTSLISRIYLQNRSNKQDTNSYKQILSSLFLAIKC